MKPKPSAHPTSPTWRQALIALSLANLCFVRVWAESAAHRTPHNEYFWAVSEIGPWKEVAWAGVVVLAALFFLLNRLFQGRGRPANQVRYSGLLLAAGIAVNGARQQLESELLPKESFGRISDLIGLPVFVAGLLVTAFILAMVSWRAGLTAMAQSVAKGVLAMFPFFLVTSAQTVMSIGEQGKPAEFTNRPLSPLLSAQPPPRVILLVFDGLDFDLPIETPAIRDMLATSTSWENAFPRTGNTLDSLPALITGRPIVSARVAAANELLLSSEDASQELPWSSEETLFTRARRLNANAALVGWYHPYCRVLADLSRCSWYEYSRRYPTAGSAFRAQLTTLTNTVPLAFRMGLAELVSDPTLTPAEWHSRLYAQIHEDARTAVGDPRLNLIFLHYPIPHPPSVGSRFLGEKAPSSGYAANVLLADMALRELRQVLSDKGLSNSTAIIVTADHWRRRRREPDATSRPKAGELHRRVRLILHLPGQTIGSARQAPIQNVAAHYLAISVLNGGIRSPDDISRAMSAWPAWVREQAPPGRPF